MPLVCYAGAMLAGLILAVHLAVIAFNIGGLIAIPLGARLGWTFVHNPVFRLLHLGSLAVVAAQALAGRACFLTLWQAEAGGTPDEEPLIMRTVNALIYWNLPEWVFAAVYVAVFGYTLALVKLVPIRKRRSPGRR
jgi:hypothetical protein